MTCQIHSPFSSSELEQPLFGADLLKVMERAGGGAVSHHVSIRIWNDVGREVLGLYLLA